MSTKDVVMEKARALSEVNLALSVWEMMNAPPAGSLEAVEAQARGIVLRSQHAAAKHEYDVAFEIWQIEGFPELSEPTHATR